MDLKTRIVNSANLGDLGIIPICQGNDSIINDSLRRMVEGSSRVIDHAHYFTMQRTTDLKVRNAICGLVSVAQALMYYGRFDKELQILDQSGTKVTVSGVNPYAQVLIKFINSWIPYLLRQNGGALQPSDLPAQPAYTSVTKSGNNFVPSGNTTFDYKGINRWLREGYSGESSQPYWDFFGGGNHVKNILGVNGENYFNQWSIIPNASICMQIECITQGNKLDADSIQQELIKCLKSKRPVLIQTTYLEHENNIPVPGTSMHPGRYKIDSKGSGNGHIQLCMGYETSGLPFFRRLSRLLLFDSMFSDKPVVKDIPGEYPFSAYPIYSVSPTGVLNKAFKRNRSRSRIPADAQWFTLGEEIDFARITAAPQYPNQKMRIYEPAAIDVFTTRLVKL